MKKSILLLLLLRFLNPAVAQESPSLENFTLGNGLKVYFIKYGNIEAVNISVIINSGKKNEIQGNQGYNGLCANLILKGNKKYTEENQNDKSFSIGGSIGARSNYDYTEIGGDFLSKDATTALDLISAAILQPLFEKEKVTQYVSYLMDYNNPTKMDIAQKAQLYSSLSLYGKDNPLGRSIYKEQLQLVTPEKLVEFYKFNYTPKNTKIIICGNFNSTELKSLIEAYFGQWKSTYGEINGVALDFPSVKKKEIYFTNRTAATQCALQWNKVAPSVKDKDVLAFIIANQLFNQTLFKEIREKGGKTYSIGSSHFTSQFSNLFNIRCSVRNDELLNTINLFDKTLSDFAQGTFTQQEFDNEIATYKTTLLSMEFPQEVKEFYNPIIYDFNTRKNILNTINTLKMDDIKKAIKKYFTPGIYKLVICGDEQIVATQLAQLKNYTKYTEADLKLKN